MKYVDEWTGEVFDLWFTVKRDKGKLTEVQAWCEDGPYATVASVKFYDGVRADPNSMFLNTVNFRGVVSEMERMGYVEIISMSPVHPPLGKFTEKFFRKEID